MNEFVNSPKRSGLTKTSRSHWFGYYAGFSDRFVKEALAAFAPTADSFVLDPWNGSGTTSEVTYSKGLDGLGVDLNPVMVVVARSRLLNVPSALVREAASELLGLAEDVEQSAFSAEDPLLRWFAPSAAASLRAFESAICRSVQSEAATRFQTLSNIGPMAAFLYVALFRVVRTLLLTFRTSNPTWLASPKSKQQRVRPSLLTIKTTFAEAVTYMLAKLRPPSSQFVPRSVSVEVGDSVDVPLDDETVDLVVSSPPYCTRIDYAVATRPELAVLNVSEKDFGTLRSRLTGTTVVRDYEPRHDAERDWGPTCGAFLRKVRNHDSHASDTYYLKTHLHYFESMAASIAEISRVVKPGARCVLVVQDSYYKEVRNDLQAILTEIAEVHSLRLEARQDFVLPVTKARVNPGSRKYRADFSATESVLVLRK